MTDGPIFRIDDDVAEALAIQHGNSIRDRIDPDLQERINAMFEIGRD